MDYFFGRALLRLRSHARLLLAGSELFDGLRQIAKGNVFQPAGYSEEQIWHKYAGALPSDLGEGEEFSDDVYYTILQKACSSNSVVDRLCGHVSSAVGAAADVGEAVADAVSGA